MPSLIFNKNQRWINKVLRYLFYPLCSLLLYKRKRRISLQSHLIFAFTSPRDILKSALNDRQLLQKLTIVAKQKFGQIYKDYFTTNIYYTVSIHKWFWEKCHIFFDSVRYHAFVLALILGLGHTASIPRRFFNSRASKKYFVHVTFGTYLALRAVVN